MTSNSISSNKATFLSNKVMPNPSADKIAIASPIDSPRVQRYQSVNEYKKYSEAIDRQLDVIRTIQEASSTSKASQTRN